jgi:predicted anti-sigma-YlaC factor YlaD
MNADNKQALRKLLIRLALLCLLLAVIGTLVLIVAGSGAFVPVVIVGFLLSLGVGAWTVKSSPLGMAMPMLKGLLYILGIALAPVMLGAMLVISVTLSSKYIAGFDTPSSGGGSHYSNSFD